MGAEVTVSFESEFLDRIKDTLDRQSALGRLSVWLEKNTFLHGRPYSFKGHEFQRDIVDSKHNDAVVIKPSQVGATEFITRLVLGFLAVESDTVAMYLLPTVGEAQRAAKSRIDPIIATSPYLRTIISAGSDSSGFKQIGSSQLITGGTFGKAVISVPTDLLTIDELDFCNPAVVATAESRLTHSRFVDEHTGTRGIKRKWSTPTAEGFGVHGLFAQSDQRHRQVRCRCSHWFWPEWLKHVVVDGWDDEFSKMTYMDAIQIEERGLLDTARIICPACHAPMKRAQLEEENREWVADFPERKTLQGWHINPFDLPAYHTPASITRKLISYGTEVGHFRNFVLGVAYSDASNSVVDEAVERNCVLEPVPPEVAKSLGISGCVAGLDVGKTSWIVIARPNLVDHGVDVIWAQQLRLRRDDGEDLYAQVMHLLDYFGVIKLVSDAMPYTDTVLSIQAARPQGWVIPNYYGLQDKKLPNFVVKDEDKDMPSLLSHRTKSLNSLAASMNSGKMRFPAHAEMKLVRRHLQGMKRVDRPEEGYSEWVKSGDDHYFHALNYLNMAADIVFKDNTSGFAPRPSIHQVVVGATSAEVINPYGGLR